MRLWPVLLLLCASAALAQGPTHGVPGGELRLAGPLTGVKAERQVYIVQLREAPALAAAQGGMAGMAATRGLRPRMAELREAGPRPDVALRLEASHQRLLSEIGAAGGKLYSYRHAFNGFAARLTPEQVAALQRHPEVIGLWPDRSRPLSSGETVRFLGLGLGDGGLDGALGLRGEDIIIGVIDSGVAPGHPSLSDRDLRPLPRLCRSEWARVTLLGRWLCRSHRQARREIVYSPPTDWNGICQAGEGFSSNDCNNKLIGARFYNEGFLASNALDPGEFLSPRDAEGHGTHIATLAAGNEVEASLFGTRVGRIRGVAPRARVAVYKACWLRPGETRATCNTSDLARAIDDAVADGVHVINYSVGNPESGFDAPDDIALLFAAEAGIFVAVAAGNDGPLAATIGSPGDSPWVTTVAASSRPGRRFEEVLRVLAPTDQAGDVVFREAAFTRRLSQTGAITGELRQVDDGVTTLPDGSPGSRDDACQPLVNRSEISGEIALIRRGGCTFETKVRRAQAAGAQAVVVYNTSGPPITMVGEEQFEIPAVMIGAADGERLVAALAAGEPVEIELLKGRLREQPSRGNVLGDFSARGPVPAAPDLVKPDLTAPGIDLLGGHTPDPASGEPGERFQTLSGTSQSAPIVAGLAALLRERHPDWSPAMIKSALMTSAYQEVVLEDGETPAGPFAMGAGHVDGNRAVAPGAVYDADLLDYAAFACGLEPPPFSAADCALLAASGLSLRPVDLNLPSIGVGALVGREQLGRRLTAVETGSFTVEVQAPPGTTVTVSPSQLNLSAGETASYTVDITRGEGLPLNEWRFGSVTWRSAERTVRSPLAVQARALAAPTELAFAGTTGEARFMLRTGYSGSYTPRAHGLRRPLVVEGFVTQDPDRRFSFREGNGVTRHLIDIPEGAAYARFALRDELTSGADDLDLYLFYCPGDICTQVGQATGLSSNETVSVAFPAPGRYAALVHGFATDPAGGAGAEYLLLAWSFGIDDEVGNLLALGPGFVDSGADAEVEIRWRDLAPDSLYLGGVSHNTPQGLQGLTIIGVDTRQP